MKKDKLFTLGLIAGSLFFASCDDLVDCGCDCNKPEVKSWEILKAGQAKNDDGTVSAGTAIVIYGKNLSEINSISFGGESVDLQPAFMEDHKIVFQVPEGISKECVAHITTVGCSTGFDLDLLKVVVSAPCITMCDNEMATKTIKLLGNSFFAPLTAKFHDGNDWNLEASTEDGTITIDDMNHCTITIPEGVAEGYTIKLISNAGETESSFKYRDKSNILISYDGADTLFTQNKPDTQVAEPDENGNLVGGMTPSKAELTGKDGIMNTPNRDGNFAIFWDNNYTALAYHPKGSANPSNKEPQYDTPFGPYYEELRNGKSIGDYVIKFEVLVTADAPMKGNGLAIGFYNSDPYDIRQFCAFWQPSKASFAINDDGVWDQTATFDTWTSGGDWLTITIPFEEIRHNFSAKNYFCSAQNGRVIYEDGETSYAAFGDDKNGKPFFEAKPKCLTSDRDKNSILGFGFIYGMHDITGPNEALIGIDNVRIVPNDNNGAYYPLLSWGSPTRDFYLAPKTSCK